MQLSDQEFYNLSVITFWRHSDILVNKGTIEECTWHPLMTKGAIQFWQKSEFPGFISPRPTATTYEYLRNLTLAKVEDLPKPMPQECFGTFVLLGLIQNWKLWWQARQHLNMCCGTVDRQRAWWFKFGLIKKGFWDSYLTDRGYEYLLHNAKYLIMSMWESHNGSRFDLLDFLTLLIKKQDRAFVLSVVSPECAAKLAEKWRQIGLTG